VQNLENPLRFEKLTESLKVGTFFETQCSETTDQYLPRNLSVTYCVKRIITFRMLSCAARSW